MACSSTPPALIMMTSGGPRLPKKQPLGTTESPQKYQIPKPIFCNEGPSTVLCDKCQQITMSAAKRLPPYSATKFRHEQILLGSSSGGAFHRTLRLGIWGPCGGFDRTLLLGPSWPYLCPETRNKLVPQTQQTFTIDYQCQWSASWNLNSHC